MSGPRGRRAERVVLATASAWFLLLAVLTLYPYQRWLAGSGVRTLQESNEVSATPVVAELAGLARAYGVVMVLVAVVCAWSSGG